MEFQIQFTAMMLILYFTYILMKKRPSFNFSFCDVQQWTLDFFRNAIIGFSIGVLIKATLFHFESAGLIFGLEAKLQEATRNFLELKEEKKYILSFMGPVLLAPVAEEILYRFFAVKETNRTSSFPLIAIILSSLMFGFSHPDGGILRIISTVLCGFFLGYFIWKSNSLIFVIAAHSSFNLMAALGEYNDEFTLIAERIFSAGFEFSGRLGTVLHVLFFIAFTVITIKVGKTLQSAWTTGNQRQAA